LLLDNIDKDGKYDLMIYFMALFLNKSLYEKFAVNNLFSVF